MNLRLDNKNKIFEQRRKKIKLKKNLNTQIFKNDKQ